MNRRDFITLLGSAAAAWPLAARAQQPVRVVGVLASQPLPPVQRFVRKLREYGYVEGENLRLQSRFAEGHDDRYPNLATELVKLPVEVIVTWGTAKVTEDGVQAGLEGRSWSAAWFEESLERGRACCARR
jgi:putative tryptophan/tyrosine transport system substrate-binding protein